MLYCMSKKCYSFYVASEILFFQISPVRFYTVSRYTKTDKTSWTVMKILFQVLVVLLTVFCGSAEAFLRPFYSLINQYIRFVKKVKVTLLPKISIPKKIFIAKF